MPPRSPLLPRALLTPRTLFTLCLGLASLGAAQTTATPAPPTPALLGADVLSVTVQPGDTAYSLARRAGLSVDALLRLNGLTEPTLRAGQVLRLREPAPATARHVVQPGETLYALSRRYGVSVDALLNENKLAPGATLAVGQELRLPPGARPATSGPAPTTTPPAVPPSNPLPTAPAQAQPGVAGSPFQPGAPTSLRPKLGPLAELPALPPVAPAPGSSRSPAPAQPAPAPSVFAPLPADWRGAALALLGTPYVYGGTGRAGTDCSGFVLQVFTPLGIRLPRVSADQAQAGRAVEDGALLPGDLVFFDTEGSGRVSHVGIYLGEDTFVNANSYQGKVVIDKLMADRYWSARYVGARRVLPEMLAQRP